MAQHLKVLALAILAVFAPAQAMILSSVALVVMDLITGVAAARKRSETITSAGLSRTVAKLLVYETAILLAFLTQTYLTGATIPVANIVAGFVGITELLSCMENLNDISGNNLLKALLEKLSNTTKS
jgi:phage-related holin